MVYYATSGSPVLTVTLLEARIVAKPWGRLELPAPFAQSFPEAIGEIWFEPPPALDALLAKYIFTSENLSVQCHPSDAQTLAKGLGRQGKEECWLILDAEPGAQVAIGFHDPVAADDLRRAALDGSIEEMLVWHPASAGDFFYIPANTVHAIGAGISLIEIQQNSDITYRLYDYGRPRDLHVEEGMSVAHGGLYPADLRKRLSANSGATLVEGPYFRLDCLDGGPDTATQARYNGAVLLLPVDCEVAVGDFTIGPGQCGYAAMLAGVCFPSGGRTLIAQPC